MSLKEKVTFEVQEKEEDASFSSERNCQQTDLKANDSLLDLSLNKTSEHATDTNFAPKTVLKHSTPKSRHLDSRYNRDMYDWEENPIYQGSSQHASQQTPPMFDREFSRIDYYDDSYRYDQQNIRTVPDTYPSSYLQSGAYRNYDYYLPRDQNSSGYQTQNQGSHAYSTGYPVSSSQYQNASNFVEQTPYHSTTQVNATSYTNDPYQNPHYNAQISNTYPQSQIAPQRSVHNASNLAYQPVQNSNVQAQTNTPFCMCVGQKEKVQVEKYDDQKWDLDDYMTHFEMVANLNKWNDVEKAQRLVINLRGSAQRLLGGLTLGQLSDYNTIKQELYQRFSPREREDVYKCEFREYKRKSGESVTDYCYALRRVAQRAYPQMPYSNLENFLVDRYIHGLGNSDLKKHVQFRHPKSLAQAIAFASEYEAVEGPIDSIKKPTDDRVFTVVQESVTNSSEIQGGAQSSHLTERMAVLERKLDQLLSVSEFSERVQNRQRGSSPNARNSVYQNGSNNSYQRSFSPRRHESQFRDRDGQSNRNPREIICNFCKGVGHIETKCRKKAQHSEN